MHTSSAKKTAALILAGTLFLTHSLGPRGLEAAVLPPASAETVWLHPANASASLRGLSYEEGLNGFRLLFERAALATIAPAELDSLTRRFLDYFFIALALPEESFWVNLRPDKPGGIIDPALAQTAVGAILLETDLLLKQDTARATAPDTASGRLYWEKLYRKAQELYGSAQVSIPTLCRPWIVPEEIVMRMTAGNAYVYKATLKVMLEEDYLQDSRHRTQDKNVMRQYSFADERAKELNEYAAQLLRELVVPELTRKVNSGREYAALRQVYQALILAQWFKRTNRSLGPYAPLVNGGIPSSLRLRTPPDVRGYFRAYQRLFRQGAYDMRAGGYAGGERVARRYFSGGIVLRAGPAIDAGGFSGTSATFPPAGTAALTVEVEARMSAREVVRPQRIVAAVAQSQADAGIASDHRAGTTRAQHLAFHRNGDFATVLRWIAQEDLGLVAGSDGWYDLRRRLQDEPQRRLVFDGLDRRGQKRYTELRLESDGALVVIDSRLRKDHAGRGQFAVYARNEGKAVHELAELRSWAAYARDELGIVSAEEIAAGRLGIRLRRWMNGLDDDDARDFSVGSLEVRRRQARIREKADTFHRDALIEEFVFWAKRQKLLGTAQTAWEQLQEVCAQAGMRPQELFRRYRAQEGVFEISPLMQAFLAQTDLAKYNFFGLLFVTRQNLLSPLAVRIAAGMSAYPLAYDPDGLIDIEVRLVEYLRAALAANWELLGQEGVRECLATAAPVLSGFYPHMHRHPLAWVSRYSQAEMRTRVLLAVRALEDLFKDGQPPEELIAYLQGISSLDPLIALADEKLLADFGTPLSARMRALRQEYPDFVRRYRQGQAVRSTQADLDEEFDFIIASAGSAPDGASAESFPALRSILAPHLLVSVDLELLLQAIERSPRREAAVQAVTLLCREFVRNKVNPIDSALLLRSCAKASSLSEAARLFAQHQRYLRVLRLDPQQQPAIVRAIALSAQPVESARRALAFMAGNAGWLREHSRQLPFETVRLLFSGMLQEPLPAFVCAVAPVAHLAERGALAVQLNTLPRAVTEYIIAYLQTVPPQRQFFCLRGIKEMVRNGGMLPEDTLQDWELLLNRYVADFAFLPCRPLILLQRRLFRAEALPEDELLSIAATGEEGIARLAARVAAVKEELFLRRQIREQDLRHPAFKALVAWITGFSSASWGHGKNEGMELDYFLARFRATAVPPLDAALAQAPSVSFSIRPERIEFTEDERQMYSRYQRIFSRALLLYHQAGSAESALSVLKEEARKELFRAARELERSRQERGSGAVLEHMARRQRAFERAQAGVAAAATLESFCWEIVSGVPEVLEHSPLLQEQVILALLQEAFRQDPAALERIAEIEQEELNMRSLDKILAFKNDYFNKIEPPNSILNERPPQEAKQILRVFRVSIFEQVYARTKTVSPLEEKPLVLRGFFTRDVLGELAGDIGDACYTALPQIMNYPAMVGALIFTTGDGPDARFAGSVLVLKNAVAGKPVWILRGINPQEDVVADYSAADFLDGVLRSCVELAQAYNAAHAPHEQIHRILTPALDEGALSNQRKINSVVKQRIGRSRAVILDHKETFNFHDITAACKELAVIVPAPPDARAQVPGPLGAQSVVASTAPALQGPAPEVGGIDLRSLPMLSETGWTAAPVPGRGGVDLEQEWRRLHHLLSAGIAPSARRIADCAAACSRSPAFRQEFRDRLLGCISQTLLIQERRGCATEPLLQRALILLDNAE